MFSLSVPDSELCIRVDIFYFYLILIILPHLKISICVVEASVNK